MNPIFQKRLDRRTLLRGVGAALALPMLDSMFPAMANEESLPKPPLRAAFLFKPNGIRPDHWTPEGDDEKFELTPLLEPLTNVKQDITLLENLWNKQTVGRNGHWPKVPAFLSGGFVVRTAGKDLNTGGTSLDQYLAERIGDRTPLPSFELGVDEAYSGVDNAGGGFTRIYGSHLAWRDPHTPVPKEIIPRLAFDRLFRTGPAVPVVSGFTSKQKSVTDSLSRDDTSILDIVSQDAKDLQRRVGTSDRLKIEEYLESVRAVERRIENALKPQKRWINEGKFEVPQPGPGIPEDHQEHVRLMLDILVLAFWSDSTRIGTFMFGNAQTGRNFSFIDGVNGSYHGLSHHRNESKTLEQYTKINHWHSVQLGYFLDQLKGLDEGGTSLLYNSMVLYGSTIRDGNKHDEKNLPLLLAGHGQGTLRPGRRIRAPKETPLCNLYLSMLDRFGIKAEEFGDSSGRLSELA